MSDTLKNLKARLARRQRNLRDPHWGRERIFPYFVPGMTTTGNYIRMYQEMNKPEHRQDVVLGPEMEFDFARGHTAPYEQAEEVAP